MDEKGRVAFPVPLAQTLERIGAVDGRMVLTQSLYDPCLVGMTEAEFQAQADKLRALPPSHPAVVAYKRFVIAPATVVTVDKVGRIIVPKELREHASLERETVWLGVIEKIELWSRGHYDALRKRHHTQDLSETRDYLSRNGL
jgi:MraZ protein